MKETRLRQAFELLRSVVDDDTLVASPATPLSAIESHWSPEALTPPLASDGLLSYQDLLGFALGQPGGELQPMPRPWPQANGPQCAAPGVDDILSPTSAILLATETGPTLAPGATPLPNSPPSFSPGRSRPPSIWPQDQLTDAQADAAVECLYDFLHAVGRRDLDTAMESVAEDYSALEKDREVDRRGLRLQLEGLLDPLRSWQIEVSLGEAPEPLYHPLGVLIDADIQLDAIHSVDATRRSVVMRRLAILREVLDGTWVILALSPIEV